MYSKEIQKILTKGKIEIGDEILLEQETQKYEGLLMPRPELGDQNCLVLKLNNGYNVGINIDDKSKIKLIKKSKPIKQKIEKESEEGEITILGCGGTISSKVEYKTGAVYPAISQKELLNNFPEIKDITTINTKSIFSLLSGDLNQKHWEIIGKEIEKELKKDIKGIVISHGTDTMHYTSSALSFMFQDLPIPIILTGAQRSSDRGSSDSKLNLLSSLMAAKSDFSGIGVCMHSNLNDNLCYVHNGTRVRKMHSSYRSTFRTIGDIPVAMVSRTEIKPLRHDYKRRRSDKDVVINTAFEERVGIVYYYPNMKPDIIDSLIDNDYRGIVIAGTGLGHVNKPLYPALKRAKEKNIAVYMTVQTLWGYVQMYVYDTGRDMMELGVVPTANMLPEVAYVKLGWALGQTEDLEEIKKIMLTPINGEITEREPSNGYLIYQGGIPEVEEFISEHRK